MFYPHDSLQWPLATRGSYSDKSISFGFDNSFGHIKIATKFNMNIIIIATANQECSVPVPELSNAVSVNEPAMKETVATLLRMISQKLWAEDGTIPILSSIAKNLNKFHPWLMIL